MDKTVKKKTSRTRKSSIKAKATMPPPPINVAIPNTSERKMEAICSIARTLEIVAKALSSVNTQVIVSNNIVSGSTSGINISTEETHKNLNLIK